eukprot:scaffold6021_cov379-Prasinococcus_capsulatus_cf.AAC.7
MSRPADTPLRAVRTTQSATTRGMARIVSTCITQARLQIAARPRKWQRRAARYLARHGTARAKAPIATVVVLAFSTHAPGVRFSTGSRISLPVPATNAKTSHLHLVDAEHTCV